MTGMGRNVDRKARKETGKGKAGPEKSESSIDPKSDLPKIEKYCIEFDVSYAVAKELYIRNNKSFPATS